MRLGIREWTCPKRQSVHDRDLNAAINIRNEGLKQLSLITRSNLVEVRDPGSEGAFPIAVSPRNSDQPVDRLERL
ncbi:MAG: transposase [Gammaproteobacteria bacterium]|nr:transposase [Gammaproteobacteria bacterium]